MIFVNVFMVLIFLAIVSIAVSLRGVLTKASVMCDYMRMFLDSNNKSHNNRGQIISIVKKIYEKLHGKGKDKF